MYGGNPDLEHVFANQDDLEENTLVIKEDKKMRRLKPTNPAIKDHMILDPADPTDRNYSDDIPTDGSVLTPTTEMAGPASQARHQS